MEKKDIRRFAKEHGEAVCYTLFIAIAGTLLHFAYDWSGNNPVVALFAAVDESVWEHLKLFFVPAFFFSLFSYFKKGETCPRYLWCQLISILAGLGFIVIFYYTYKGIAGREITVLSVGSFYVAAVLAGFISDFCCSKGEEQRADRAGVAGVVLLLLWALFIWFTYQLPLPLVEWFPGLFLES